jgi:parallel beta-helix repeat protein
MGLIVVTSRNGMLWGVSNMFLNTNVYCLIVACTIVSMLVIPVFADNETVSSGDPGTTDLLNGQMVLIAPTDTPAPDVTTIPTTMPTTVPTTGPATTVTTVEVTTQPTDIPTTVVTTPVPLEEPPVNESATSSPAVDIPVVNDTTEGSSSNGTPDQPMVTPQGNIAIPSEPDINLTVTSPEQTSGNLTPGLVDNTTVTLDLSATAPKPDTKTSAGCNYTWSDPPLNTSMGNQYYTGDGWIINESGHVWQLDLANISTSGPGIIKSDNTLTGFGNGFAILINASNVIFDGMGAILQGNGNTDYGIIVNNQTADTPGGPSLGPLSGISITNITLTGFTQAGIFFCNVIGSQSEVSSNITNVHADSNLNAGIVLKDSQEVELRDNTANNNGNSSQSGSNGYGIVLENSIYNILANNTAQENYGGAGLYQYTNGGNGYGIYLLNSDSNNLTRNNASANYGGNGWGGYTENAGNGYGIYLLNSDSNNLTRNNADGNHGGSAGGWSFGMSVSINSASGDSAVNETFDNQINGGDGYGIYLNASGSNLLSGNNASGNYGGNSDTNAATDFRLRLSGSAVFSGNLSVQNSFNGGSGYGIFLTGSDENNLTGNTVRNNYGGLNGIFDLQYFGFRAMNGGSSSFNITLGNVGSGGNGYGISLDNSSGSSLSGNHVAGNHGSPEEGTGVNYTIDILTGNGGVYNGSLIFNHINAGNAGYGIYLNASPGTTLEENEASGNYGGLAGGTMGITGINITTMMGGTSTDNPETRFVNTGGYGYGIYVLGSGDTTMQNNHMDGNDGNFALYGNEDFHYANDIYTTNLVNGRKVLYLRDAHGLVIGPSSDAGTVYVINGSGVTLKDLDLDYNGPGVLLWNTTGSTLRNITARNNDYGIVLGRSSGNHLEESNASANRQHGILLAGSDGNTVDNNTASGNTYAGVVLYASDGDTLVNTTTSGNGFAGFEFRRGNDNTVQNNTATGNAGTWNQNGYGFYLVNSDNNHVSGNNATGNHGGNGADNVTSYMSNYDNGEYFNFSQYSEGGNGYGFYLENSDNNTLSENHADYNYGGTGGSLIDGIGEIPEFPWFVPGGNGYGFYIGGADNTNLSGNTANGNAGGTGGTGSNGSTDNPFNEMNGSNGGPGGNGYGIVLLGANYSNVTANNATSNTGGLGGPGGKAAGTPGTCHDGATGIAGKAYGVVLDGSVWNNLTGNTANGNHNDGFTVTGSDYNVFDRNNAGDNHDDGFRVVSSAFNSFTRNNVSGNQNNGIQLISSGWNNLSGNTANGNHNDGIRLFYSGWNNLSGNSVNGSHNDGIGLLFSGYNNLTGNSVNGSHNDGINLIFSGYNNLTGNNATGCHNDGFTLIFSDYTNVSGNTATGNKLGLSLHESCMSTITGNTITGNTAYGISLNDSSGNNLVYNNYFNNTNNTFVSTDSTGNIWNITPTPGTNIVGGPNLGGNYWATPTGDGWSQTHPDIGMGFTEPYNITNDLANVDQHPLTLNAPVPLPGPSGSYSVVIQPVTPGTLPYDSSFTGNNIPGSMESCHSYTVGVTVKNTGTVNWSSANGVVLVPSSSNGFTFDPSRCTIPAGIVVQPGQSYTFPVTITVPCPMKDGTFQLRFKMAYTVQTKSGPVEVPFGDTLTNNVTVGASSKSGVKSFAPTTTIPGSSGRFTTSIPSTADNDPTTSIAPGYYAGISRSTLNGTVARNFLPVTGLLWSVFVPDE